MNKELYELLSNDAYIFYSVSWESENGFYGYAHYDMPPELEKGCLVFEEGELGFCAESFTQESKYATDSDTGKVFVTEDVFTIKTPANVTITITAYIYI